MKYDKGPFFFVFSLSLLIKIIIIFFPIMHIKKNKIADCKRATNY